MGFQIPRYAVIEVTVNTSGQTNIPDQPQLHGCVIVSVTTIPPFIANYSPITKNATVAQTADLQMTTLTLQRQSNQIIQNIPLLVLNPFQTTSTEGLNTPGQQMREIMVGQEIDWNQSFLNCAVAPSDNVVYSFGIYYYNPQIDIIPGKASLY
jgi:hypothetical protein